MEGDRTGHHQVTGRGVPSGAQLCQGGPGATQEFGSSGGGRWEPGAVGGASTALGFEKGAGVAQRRGHRKGGKKPACLSGHVWRGHRGGAALFGPNTDGTPPTGPCLDAGGGCGLPGPRDPDKSLSASGLRFPRALQLCGPSRLGGRKAEHTRKVRAQPPVRKVPHLRACLHEPLSHLPPGFCPCWSPGQEPRLSAPTHFSRVASSLSKAPPSPTDHLLHQRLSQPGWRSR